MTDKYSQLLSIAGRGEKKMNFSFFHGEEYVKWKAKSLVKDSLDVLYLTSQFLILWVWIAPETLKSFIPD